jgi:hypothetical protein
MQEEVINIYVDGKIKAELPDDINTDKLIEIFKVYYFKEWKEIKIKQEVAQCLEKHTSAENADTCTPAKVK